MHLRGDRQPQQRATHEQLGGHQVCVHAIGEHHQMEADKPHVVRQRHPRQAGVVFVEAGGLRGAVDVGNEVGVGQHDALGLTG